MDKKIKSFASVLLMAICGCGFAQTDSIQLPDTNLEPPNMVVENTDLKKDSTNFKRVKLDGIAAVIGDYVILDSDIEKTLIDLRNQGASTEDVTRCGLLGSLRHQKPKYYLELPGAHISDLP